MNTLRFGIFWFSSPVHLLGSAALGKDMADEYVYPGAAGVYCCALGRQVHHSIPGVPLHPHHDRAAAPPHPVQDFRGTRAAGGRLHSLVIPKVISCHQNLIPDGLEIRIKIRYLFYMGIFIHRKHNIRKALACFHMYHTRTFCKINN